MHDEPDYYRILQVQPDAPVEVIRQNYRLLLNKLRMHPDLGGSQAQAVRINAAYDTLQDPAKRAAYNRRLCSGQFPFLPFFPQKTAGLIGQTREENRRNYYRILQVHPEARPEIIRARYLAMLDQADPPHDLLHEAFALLNDARKRARYDQLLKHYYHRTALEILQAETESAANGICMQGRYPVAADKETLPECIDEQGGRPPMPAPTGHCVYPGGMTRNCPICGKTCAVERPGRTGPFCPVCGTPLLPVGEEMFGRSTRLFERCRKRERIFFYPAWPGQKESGRLYDISPSGLRMSSAVELRCGQVIQIESTHFKAAAEVVHCRIEGGVTSYGLRFRTVCFGPERGYFLSTSA